MLVDPRLFSPDGVYLNTATYGLPSTDVAAAMTGGLDRWRRGVATMAEYDSAVTRSRELAASILGVDADRVAAGSQTSVFAGLIATSLPEGCRVLIPEGEFTSLLFPFLVQQRHGVEVVEVPHERLAGAIDGSIDVVAFSLVRSADGVVAQADAIRDAARAVGAQLVVDATQGAGWLPFDPNDFDFTIISAYKWLLCPRGTAFLVVGPDAQEPAPIFAGWYAGEEIWKSTYGGPLRLADSARRFDVSPAWLSWLGAEPALRLIDSVGVEAIHRHNVSLGDTVRAELGMPESNSAMVTIPMDNTDVLAAHGIEAAVRSGSVRVGFHLYNTADDVERLLAAVRT